MAATKSASSETGASPEIVEEDCATETREVESDDDSYAIELMARTNPPWTSKDKVSKILKGQYNTRYRLLLVRDETPNKSIKAVDEADSCTKDNWQTFFSFREQDAWGESTEITDSSPFESDHLKKTKSLILTRSRDPNHQLAISLAIKSPYLQKQFRKFIDIQHYHNVTLSASTTVISSPFAPLYHHLDDINRQVTGDPDVSEADCSQMNAIVSFVTLGWPAGLFGDVKSMLSQGFITYPEIWALFKPGDLVITKDPIGHSGISKVTSVKYERESTMSGWENRWWVTMVQITRKSGEFRKSNIRRRIGTFADARKITDLDFYPLSYHTDKDELREKAICRGKDWKKYMDSGPRVMTFEGEALPLVTIKPPRSSRRNNRYEEESEDEDNNTLRISSSVIVDPGANAKAIMQASIDDKSRLWHYTFHDGCIVNADAIVDFSEEDYMICPASMSVFSLDDHDWYSVDVGKLKEKIWKPKSFERLVLEKERKNTLIRLASTNSRQIQSFKSKDVIEGKGKGMIMLLHGPPGVGKTLTAEVLSEYTQRPLLKVNLGRVASHDQWEQSLEQIFSNAEDWKAILLIDEAEIVLEKRTFERMTQNSWISVFLRKLEYYQGILILTTNLIDCIDEAFESRISYPIRFQELRREDRHQIWTDFINAMNMLQVYKQALLKEVDRWSEAEINGRQIRNIILMAENLAASDVKHSRLMPHHVEELLDVTLEFVDYNQHNAARMKKIQLSGPSY